MLPGQMRIWGATGQCQLGSHVMDCKITSIKRARRRAFTLVQLVVGSGIGSLVVMAACHMTFFSARSFVAMANYVDLELRSRNALDTMTREIRQSKGLASFNETNLTFTDFDLQSLQYNYDPSAGTLSRIKNGVSTVLLTSCDTLTF